MSASYSGSKNKADKKQREEGIKPPKIWSLFNNIHWKECGGELSFTLWPPYRNGSRGDVPPCVRFVRHRNSMWTRQSQGEIDLPFTYASHTTQPPGAWCFFQDKPRLTSPGPSWEGLVSAIVDCRLCRSWTGIPPRSCDLYVSNESSYQSKSPI
jgi:hypothetical protein